MTRKIPKKGIDWVLWTFPNLALKSIYRRFAPYRETRQDMRYNEMMTDRWSIAYFFVGWTLAGYVVQNIKNDEDSCEV
jgi:hypothetical protein